MAPRFACAALLGPGFLAALGSCGIPAAELPPRSPAGEYREALIADRAKRLGYSSAGGAEKVREGGRVWTGAMYGC